MGWPVALTDEALTDLEQVVAFLAQKSPTAAERIGLELVELIFSLDQLPKRGAVVRNRPALRKTRAPALPGDLPGQRTGGIGGDRPGVGQPPRSGPAAVAVDGNGSPLLL